MDIHTRTLMIDNWSLISNAAIRIGDDTLEVVNDGTFFFNGMQNTDLPVIMSGRFEVTSTQTVVEGSTESGEVTKDIDHVFKINLGNDDDITVSIWKTMISVKVNAYLKNAEGMLGNHGKVGLIGRDRQTVHESANEMGLAWQVRDNESMLFADARVPQFPQECILPSVQGRRRRLRENNGLTERAEKACASVEESMRAFCIEDVMLIGDEHVAVGYSDRF